MRIILGCTLCTSTAAMRYVLDLPTMRKRHKIAQVKSLLRVTSDTDHPLHSSLSAPCKSRLKRGASWMTQAQETVAACCAIKDIRRGKEWTPAKDMSNFTTVIATLGRECREWPANATEAEIQASIGDISRPGDAIIYTDGSVVRGQQSGWAFTVRANGGIIHEDAGAFSLTTSSMCMEINAITEALSWLQTQQFTHAVIVTDSMSTLQKIKGGQLYTSWITSIENSCLKKITWLFCPGHAGVKGNERADKLAGSAALRDTVLTLDPPTVMSMVKEQLRETDSEPESHTVERLVSKGIQRGAGRDASIGGSSRRISNQMMMDTISLPTLRWTLQRRAEQLWVCPDC